MVLKNSDPAFLLQALESAARGQSWIDPELRERIGRLTDGVPGRAPLAPRERELVSASARACATARSPSSSA